MFVLASFTDSVFKDKEIDLPIFGSKFTFLCLS